MKYQQGLAVPLLILVLLVPVLVFGVIYYKNNSQPSVVPNPTTKIQVTPSEKSLEPTSTTTPEFTLSQPSDWSIEVDLMACKVGEGRSQVHEFGSRSLTINKNNDDTCVMNYINEVEGGYTVYECTLPKTLKTILPLQLDTEKYCKQTKSGNYLQER